MNNLPLPAALDVDALRAVVELPPRDALAALARWGVEPDQARCLLNEPYVQYLRGLFFAHQKAISFLELLADHYRELPPIIEYDQVPEPPSFFQNHLYANRPAVLRGCLNEWPPVRKWTFDFLNATYGSYRVKVSANRDPDRLDHELRPLAYLQELPLSNFLDYARRPAGDGRMYITAACRVLEQPEFAPLLDDVVQHPLGFLTAEPRAGDYNLWIGPGGTFITLHHDRVSGLLAQVCGEKRVILVPAVRLSLMRNTLAEFSDFNIQDPQTLSVIQELVPEMVDLVLQAGDALFIPVGWWHSVSSLTPNISVTFHRFATREATRVWKRGWHMQGTGDWSLRPAESR